MELQEEGDDSSGTLGNYGYMRTLMSGYNLIQLHILFHALTKQIPVTTKALVFYCCNETNDLWPTYKRHKSNCHTNFLAGYGFEVSPAFHASGFT